MSAYESLMAAAKLYRNALLALSTGPSASRLSRTEIQAWTDSFPSAAASTGFASALEECARVKGAGESADHLLAASGLQYMVANSGQVLVSQLQQ